jgi:hypothetical protein
MTDELWAVLGGGAIVMVAYFIGLGIYIAILEWRERRRRRAWSKYFAQWMDDLKRAESWEERQRILATPPSRRIPD